MDSSISIILHAYVHYSLSIWKYCRVSERNISEYLDKRETIASWMNHTLTLTKLCSEYLKMKFAVVLYGDKRKYLPSSRSFDSTIICPTTGCPSSCWSSYAVGGEFLLKESLGHLEKMRLTLKQFEACEFNYLYLIPVCYGCLQIHPTQAASGGRSRFSVNFYIYQNYYLFIPQQMFSCRW